MNSRNPSALGETAAPAAAEAAAPVGARTGGISYRVGLVIAMSLLVVATGLTIVLIGSRAFRRTTESLSNSIFQQASEHAVTQTHVIFVRAVRLARTLNNLSRHGLATNNLNQLGLELAAFRAANPEVTWISFSDPQGSFVGAYRSSDGTVRLNQTRIVDGKTQMVENEVKNGTLGRILRQNPDSHYDPRTRPFYIKAVQSHRVVWLPPYMFFGQDVAGVTCAKAIYDPDGRVEGVFTIDFDLTTLSQFVDRAAVNLSANGKLFIMTGDGAMVAHPDLPKALEAAGDSGKIPQADEFSDPVVRVFWDQLRPEDRIASAQSEEGRAFSFLLDGNKYYARATTVSIEGELTFIVAAAAPESDFMHNVWQADREAAMTSALSALLAVILAMILARRVSGPVMKLAAYMHHVGEGDLTLQADFGGAREFRQLSAALNRMIADLRDRLRLRHSLGVAMQVQQNLLPSEPPKITGLDIAGFSAYSDETGGDYFDYLLLRRSDRQALLVAIGDVTGHGIGSALSMAGARAILRSHATETGDLGELLGRMNRQLIQDLRPGVFMTMELFLIIPGGETMFSASAGHDPAIIFDPQTGEFSETSSGDIPLGIEGEVAYGELTYKPVRPGQVIVMATDGVWEADAENGEMFGKDRLREAIRATAGKTADEISAAINQALTDFRGSAKQRDDVTFVVVKIAG
jgi:sigma-B regulation protein RsbU (phosphoserine phosphatase)